MDKIMYRGVDPKYVEGTPAMEDGVELGYVGRTVFVNVTGTFETLVPPFQPRIIQKGKPVDVGTYGINQNILAFVDENMDVWVTRCNDKALEALRDAGMVPGRGKVYVPHTNDENYWLDNMFPKCAAHMEEAYWDDFFNLEGEGGAEGGQ